MQLTTSYRQYPYVPHFGPPTARANFCEEDYIITPWIAEFANTLTNIAYVLCAIQGLNRTRSQGNAKSSQTLYYGLVGVGVCSALFHGLLKYSAQMGDDASMQIATGLVLHRAMTFGRDARFTRTFTVGLVAMLSLELAYHTSMDEQIAHDLTFITQILLVGIKTKSLIKSRVTASQDKRTLTQLTILGASCFILGYTLWQFDFIFCTSLSAIKRSWGLPWGFLLELHGWWHVLTAVGAYVFITMVDSLTQERIDTSTEPLTWFGVEEREVAKRE